MKLFTIIINVAITIFLIGMIITNPASDIVSWLVFFMCLFVPVWNIIFLLLPSTEITKLKKEIAIKKLKNKLAELR